MLRELLSNDTFVGVVIGGLFTALPTILIACMENGRQRRQQKHEIKMKKIQLIYETKIQVLQQYETQAGAMMGNAFEESYSRGAFMAAHERAIPFVSEATKNAMKAAVNIILDNSIRPEDKIAIPEIINLDRQLRSELNLDLD